MFCLKPARCYATKIMLRWAASDKTSRAWAALLIAFVVAVYLFSPVTVSLDGYSHLYNAYALNWTLTDQANATNYFSLNSPFIPNWIVSLLLIGLSFVLPAEFALKLFVISTFLFLYASLLLFAREMRSPRPLPGYAYIVFLPLTLNVFFSWGFFGFLIGTSLCLVAVSLFLNPAYRTRLSSQVVLFVLLLSAYFSNPFPALLSFLFPLASLGYVLYRERQLSPDFWMEVRLAWPWAPIAGLVLWFSKVLDSSGGAKISVLAGLADVLRERIQSVASGQGFSIAFSGTVANLLPVIVILLVAVFVLDPWYNKTANRKFVVPLVVFGATSFLYFVAPSGAGKGSYIAERILLISILSFAAITLAHVQMAPRIVLLCSLLATAYIFLFGAEYALVARRMAPAVRELQNATQTLPSGSSALILTYELAPGCGRWPLLNQVKPERHWALAASLNPQLIVLNNYEPAISIFPLSYRDNRFAPIGLEFEPLSDQSRQNWTKALSEPGPDLQLVISWGIPSGGAACKPIEPPFQDLLRKRFGQIFAKKGYSQISIWRRTM